MGDWCWIGSRESLYTPYQTIVHTSPSTHLRPWRSDPTRQIPGGAMTVAGCYVPCRSVTMLNVSLPVVRASKQSMPLTVPLSSYPTTPFYRPSHPRFPLSPISSPALPPLNFPSPPRLPLPNARPLPLAPNLARHMPPHNPLLPERRLLPQLTHVHLPRLGLVHEAGAVREGVALRGGRAQ